MLSSNLTYWKFTFELFFNTKKQPIVIHKSVIFGVINGVRLVHVWRHSISETTKWSLCNKRLDHEKQRHSKKLFCFGVLPKKLNCNKPWPLSIKHNKVLSIECITVLQIPHCSTRGSRYPNRGGGLGIRISLGKICSANESLRGVSQYLNSDKSSKSLDTETQVYNVVKFDYEFGTQGPTSYPLWIGYWLLRSCQTYNDSERSNLLPICRRQANVAPVIVQVVDTHGRIGRGRPKINRNSENNLRLVYNKLENPICNNKNGTVKLW